MVHLLLDANADPNALDDYGKTPLHLREEEPFGLQNLRARDFDILEALLEGHTHMFYSASGMPANRGSVMK